MKGELRVFAASGRSGMRQSQFALLASFGGSAMRANYFASSASSCVKYDGSVSHGFGRSSLVM